MAEATMTEQEGTQIADRKTNGLSHINGYAHRCFQLLVSKNPGWLGIGPGIVDKLMPKIDKPDGVVIPDAMFFSTGDTGDIWKLAMIAKFMPRMRNDIGKDLANIAKLTKGLRENPDLLPKALRVLLQHPLNHFPQYTIVPDDAQIKVIFICPDYPSKRRINHSFQVSFTQLEK